MQANQRDDRLATGVRQIPAIDVRNMNSQSLSRKIGQLFLVGFAGETLAPSHPLAADIAEGNLGGVILFDRLVAQARNHNNIVSSGQVAELTSALQSLADGKLLVAVDQEGGRVSRFKGERGFPETPPAHVLGGASDCRLTRESARQTALMLKRAGVNFNLAPVVDLNVYPENPIIGRYGRSFSDQAPIVAAHAAAWIAEHRQAGIACCIKHFPGHGSSREDSHLGFVDITTTWRKEELVPYQLLLGSVQNPAVMVGHLFHAKLDPIYPATLSVATIGTLLRGDLNFQGLIVSDDMQMKAITDHYGLAEGCCRALAAGIDLLIVGNNLEHDPLIFRKLQAAVLAAIDRGNLAEERIDEACGKVQEFKKSLKIDNFSSTI